MPLLYIACFSLILLIGCGSPVVPPVGTSWDIEITSANWVAPDNIEDVAGLLTGNYGMMLGISTTDGTTADFILGTSEDGQQQMCNRTVTMPAVSFDETGAFVWGPQNFSLANGIQTKQLVLTGVYDEASGGIELAVSGTTIIDTIPEEDFSIGGLTVCELLDTIQVACEACAEGQCLFTEVNSLVGSPGGSSVRPVDLPDCHEECDTSVKNPDCTL